MGGCVDDGNLIHVLGFFVMKMGPKVKKEARAPPKAKAKAFRANKAEPKGMHSHTKKIHMSPIF